MMFYSHPRRRAWLTPSARFAAAILFAASISLASPGHASADLVLSAPSITAAPGSSGTFDLAISNNNAPGGASYLVAADSEELTLTGSGVTFTNVTPNTTLPYIFVVSATTLGGDFSFDTFPNTSFTTFDIEFAPLGYRDIAPGDTFGVAQVSYTVDPSASPSTLTMDFTDVGGATSLSDANGNAIPFGISPGSITIAAVPEPASLSLLGIAAAGLLRRRHK